MYLYYCDVASNRTPEIVSFENDCDLLGMVRDFDKWHVTDKLASKFREHLRLLLLLAESGNPLAQYAVAVIYMLGYCYTSQSEYLANYEKDMLAATHWLIRAARQGVVVAIDNLIATGVGPEVQRLRSILNEIEEEKKSGSNFPPGETWRRAYGAPVPEHESNG